MGLVRVSTLLLLAAGVAGLVYLALEWRVALGGTVASPPRLATVFTGLLALGTLAVAWPIRRWNAGERDRAINPLRAARTLALAKAAAYSGAALAGLWGGFVVQALPRLELQAQSQQAAEAAVAALVAVGLAVAGLVAERWCRIPPDGDGPEAGERSSASPA